MTSGKKYKFGDYSSMTCRDNTVHVNGTVSRLIDLRTLVSC